jgi:choline dehydrogenase-like flavoprotein
VSEQTVDLVVLGGGSGGYAAALRAAELGMTVVMIEKDKVGGTCLHRGCIPTKALLHSAETVDVIKEAEQFGVHGSFDRVEMTEVNRYKDKVVEGLFKGLTGLVKSRKIEVVQGHGKLVSSDRRGGGRPHHRGRPRPAGDRLGAAVHPGPRHRPRARHQQRRRAARWTPSRARSSSWAPARSAASSPRSGAPSAPR